VPFIFLISPLLYGEPRLTNDMDIVLAMMPHTAASFLSGFDPKEFYLPPVEILAHEATRGHELPYFKSPQPRKFRN
jgi:hypothetical protein